VFFFVGGGGVVGVCIMHWALQFSRMLNLKVD
jgi:hypothetical protein